ncbi:hypothetical protein K474DRAFT_1693993 [Panus rudis PR-1116 ss-1]|nr:hypothetical protein K474DRAFT_1693993 [Panus rudis PR-1116 ss-1]
MDLLDHQRIVDVLASDGNLNSRVLNILRMSEVECLDLTASMTDEEGLNLDARELLHVFSKPNSFIFLNEMNLSGVRLSDTDVLHIHHLPRLSRLWISNTGIGNEAIFYLVSLKRSLTELDIAFNTGISDDAVPALILMHKLRFLTLLDTSIEMPGLRRLCAAITSRRHLIELEVPRECELYIEKLGKKYLVQPEAPLITDPHVVRDLSIAALKRNLSAHAEYNHAILAEGSREEMADRLTTLLETRQADLIVRSILWKDDVTMVDDKDDDDYDSDDVF